MKKKMWKKFLPITMAVVMLATSMPVDALANTVSQNDVNIQTEQQVNEPMDDSVLYTEESTTGDLLDGTTISLQDVMLQATYKEAGDATTTIVDIVDGGNFELPYNADIIMRLDFILANGNAIENGKQYIYKLPDSIRVDVDDVHELEDGNGDSIGNVHIAKDGTLTFQFYADDLAGNTDVDFYVQFEGGLSEDLQAADKEVSVNFPTASGDFDFTIKTTDTTENTEDPEPKDVFIQKSGTQMVDNNGQKVIEWTVELGPEGRDALNGTIIDNLPAGLEYVANSAKLEGAYEGSVSASMQGGALHIAVNDVKTHYHASVKFQTTYSDAFSGTITNNTGVSIENEAVFNPTDEPTGVTDKGTAWITPDVMSKTGVMNSEDHTIEWTVTLNKEQLDLQGAIYKDTIGEGMELVAGSIQVQPAGPTVAPGANGFEVSFPAGSEQKDTYTITYKTNVTDWTVASYKNTAELDGGTDPNFDLSQVATVPGLNLLDKTATSFDPITNTFTWNLAVNTSEEDLHNVVVTDLIPDTMTFVSASIEPTAKTENPDGSTTVQFDMGNVSEKTIITIVTRVKDPTIYNPTQYYEFRNDAQIACDEINTTITDSASQWMQITAPNLMSKTGQMKNGVIEWTVTVDKPQGHEVEGITVKDVLPEGTEYVPGSFRVQNQWYDANPLYRTPQVTEDGSGQTISYTLDTGNAQEAEFLTKDFWFVYETRVTDRDKATESTTYVNNAHISMTLTGDVEVEDDASATVTGVVGGVIDKTYSYKTGEQTVTWDIIINQSRNDMKDVKNPKISDQLADYFDYVSGTLYLVDEQGNESAVAASDYIVSVVNNKLIVQLPKDASGNYLGTNCYIFRFTTRFNVIAAKLEGQKIKNTANFVGEGENRVTESDVVNNVSFSSSSAGAVIKREIRVRKVDKDTKQPLAGAKFELYLGSECIGEAISGDNGYAIFEDLNSITGYTVTLKEIQAPNGYIAVDDEVEIEFIKENLTTENGVDYYQVEIENASKTSVETGNINIKKTDALGNLLPGAVFGLYRDATCQDLIESREAANGTINFSKMAQGTYYVKEISSPAGYIASNQVVKVEITLSGSVIEVLYDDVPATETSFVNEKAVAKLQIVKQKTMEEGQVTPPVLLPNAVFSIYKDALCTDRVDTQTTDVNGELSFDGLELGKTYYYREVTPPAGYILDGTIHEITIGDGTEVENVTETAVLENDEALGNIVIHKVDNSATPVPLEGVEFDLYRVEGAVETLVQSGVLTDGNGIAVFNNVAFGDYIIKEVGTKAGYKAAVDTAVTVSAVGDTDVTIINEKIVADIKITKRGTGSVLLPGAEFGLYTTNGLQVGKGATNADGELYFYDIPYGNYVIRELKAPAGYNIQTAETNVTVAMFENNIVNGELAFNIENQKQNGKIQIKKVDINGTIITTDAAEFTLYDENMLKVAAADITNPVTNDTGTGYALFENLPYGTYYVQETKAPDGYVRDPGVYKVVVNSDSIISEYVKNDGTTEALIITNLVSYSPYISFKLQKTDAETNLPLAGAIFELYKNGQPSGITAVTNADGVAIFKRAQIEGDADATVYSVVETQSPTGYKITADTIVLGDKDDVEIFADPRQAGDPELNDSEILWIDGNNLTTATANGTITNTPLKGSLKVTKTGINASVLLKDAQFTLYKEDKVTPVAQAVTNANGVAQFNDLKVGIYYLKETKAPKGYTLNTTETKVVVTDESIIEVTYKDTPIVLNISKKAVGGEAELQGAVFKIYEKGDATKTAVDSWTSNGAVHRVMSGALEVGKTYVLTEMTAPSGYGYMADQEFTVNQDGSITLAPSATAEKSGQTLIVRDRKIALKISKQDAAVPGVELPNAILGIYDKNGTEVLRFTSGTMSYNVDATKLVAPNPDAVSGFAVYNEYTLKEISAPDGYELAEDIRFAVKADGTVWKVQIDSYGTKTYDAIGTNPIVMTDTKKETDSIYIRKLNEKTALDIAGATLQIVEDSSGNVLATWDSDGTPHKVECGYGKTLTYGETYILREKTAPAGYMIADDIKFTVTEVAGEAVISIVSGNANNLNGDKDTLMMRDQELELKIRKQDSFGQVLNGAVLTVSEYDPATDTVVGEIIEFTSGGGAAQSVPSKDLVVGKSYVLHEVSAPDGYHKAADIVFTIQPDGSLQRADNVPVYNNTIVMEDDEAGLSIGKISLNTKEGLAGSKLELTTKDDPYFTTETWVSDGTNRTWDLLDFTPGCTYILTELEAPKGYALTDPIIFTIDADDHQIYINGEKADNRTVHIADGKLELAVDKLDFYSKENVKGAKLGIFDENGNMITSWTSGVGKIWVDTTEMVVQANGYQEYILREIEVPEGYEKADDIRFAFDRDGKVYLVSEDPVLGKQYEEMVDKVVTMYDVPQICVDKVDLGGNPIVGAKLQIIAKDDTSFVPIVWTTDGNPHWLATGTFKEGVTYVLQELEAPDGYALAKDMTFTVNADGAISVEGQKIDNRRIVMLDCPIEIYIKKIDLVSGQNLAGAQLAIKDEKGNVLHTFVSEDKATLLPKEIFKAPKAGERNYYVLTELAAPAGYALTEDIAFAMDSDGIIYIRNVNGDYVPTVENTITMADALLDSGTSTPVITPLIGTNIPKTGDGTPLGTLMLFMTFGLFGACMTFGGYLRRKYRKSE